ncbi:MAG: DNA helicase RecQ [Spirochaetales bacterium]|nr:DNA helicase RecQ [Spirochaetales bacterium]
MPDVKKTLRNVFGFKDFRANQQEIVEAIVQGRDVFAAMPTGGGKSLCYQLPAAVMDGVAVVVSPLIALMKDQVDAAQELGLAAEFVNSTLSQEEFFGIMDRLDAGRLKLLYVSPERLNLEGFAARLKGVNISFFAIDEAHCLSEWGHDFRPDYLALSDLKKKFPSAHIAAFTATATKRVQQDIVKRLNLDEPFVLRASFDRPELTYRVIAKSSANQQITDIIKGHNGESGIIYRTSRKDVDSTATFLKKNGIKALAYHAGMTPQQRQKCQDSFKRDKVQVVVATIAFGMGIDKSDIRFVVHGDLPRSVEGYYQETGRAGRDGEASFCYLLFSRSDIFKIRYHIDNIIEPAAAQQAKSNLSTIVSFATKNVCRRKQLLAYFDEAYPQENCSGCDVCLDEVETEDAGTNARIFMSAMARTEQRFGIVHIIDIVRGANTEKIRKFDHHNIKTYGARKSYSKQYWSALADELIGQGCIFQNPDRFNALQLTEKGVEVLYGRKDFFMTKFVEPKSAAAKAVKKHQAKEVNPQAQALFEHLRAVRKEIADQKNLPPFVIFSNKTLKEMAEIAPRTEAELLTISGIGEKKLESYGAIFLAAVREYQ